MKRCGAPCVTHLWPCARQVKHGRCYQHSKGTPMDTHTLARVDDPWTSSHAAVTLDHEGRSTLKDAIVLLLAEEPRTGDELVRAYTNVAEVNRWPLVLDSHNVKRRLSELHTKHGVIEPSGDTRLSAHGKPATVWRLAMGVEAARVIVGAKK